jgi:arylsulfatase A-like enzyme
MVSRRWLAVLLFVLLACGGPAVAAPAEVSLLEPTVPRLEIGESLSIDFTQPAAYAHLGQGWLNSTLSLATLGAEGALGAQSLAAELRVTVLRPRPLRLVLEMMPHLVENLAPQQVSVVWNNRRLGECRFDLSQGWKKQSFSFEVPAEAITPGENHVHFLSRFAVSAAEVGRSGDGRLFAFGLYSLRLEEPEAEPAGVGREAPLAAVEGTTLKQAADSRVIFPMRLPATGPCVFSVTPLPCETAQARVLVRADFLERVEVLEIPIAGKASEPLSVDLSRFQGRAAEIVLESLGGCAQWRQPLVRMEKEAPAVVAAKEATSPRVENLVFVVLDALRADRMGYAGYRRDTTPFVDALATRAQIFTRAYAAAPYTYSSTWSLFTGRYPFQHQGYALPNIPAPTYPRLAQVLQSAGVVTALIPANPFLVQDNAFSEGFVAYASAIENLPLAAAVVPGRSAQEVLAGRPELVTAEALSFLAGHREQRFFLYAHYRQPHAPYYATAPHYESFVLTPTERFPGTNEALNEFNWGLRALPEEGLRQLEARYDENLRVADAEIRKLWEAVEALGLAEKTALVITSDHGEAFLEHGHVAHSQSVYGPELHIPLLILLPGSAGARRIETVCSNIDLFPTVCALLGVPAPADLPGRGLLAGGAEETRDADTVQAFAADYHATVTQEAYIFGRYKLLHRVVGGTFELYDLQRDPGEQSDLAPIFPVLTRYYQARAMAWRAAQAPAQPPHLLGAPLDEDTRGQLQALGYLN